MKYIDSEKLIAEIERLYDEHSSKYEIDEAAIVLDKLEDLIASLQQEEPEVDLEKEIDRLWPDLSDEISGPHNEFDIYARIARHFYGLRNRALEDAARHVYESWNGGTMDDVRRDMVGLGKVLNAREK